MVDGKKLSKKQFNLYFMDKYEQLINDLETELSKIETVQENILTSTEKEIALCRLSLLQMREWVLKEKFPDRETEVCFFKHLKPKVYGKLLFYMSIFEIEGKKPEFMGSDFQRKYYENELEKLHAFFEANAGLVQYLRCGCTSLDDLYFVRGVTQVPAPPSNHYFLVDEQFCTLHDYTVSLIRANEELCTYIQQQISTLDIFTPVNSPDASVKQIKSTLNWTGSKLALVELVYSLHYSGMINGGLAGIKELADVFQTVFNIDLKEYYRTWLVIRQRKKERTTLLDHMKTTLLRKMDEADG